MSAVSSPSKASKQGDKKDAKGKKDKKGKAEEPPPEEVKSENAKPDPLASKFIPAAIRVGSNEVRSI